MKTLLSFKSITEIRIKSLITSHTDPSISPLFLDLCLILLFAQLSRLCSPSRCFSSMMQLAHLHLALLLLAAKIITAAQPKCYFPDRKIVEKNHVPCNQTIAAPSACCDPLDSCSTSDFCLGRSGLPYRGSMSSHYVQLFILSPISYLLRSPFL